MKTKLKRQKCPICGCKLFMSLGLIRANENSKYKEDLVCYYVCNNHKPNICYPSDLEQVFDLDPFIELINQGKIKIKKVTKTYQKFSQDYISPKKKIRDQIFLYQKCKTNLYEQIIRIVNSDE